MVFARMAVRRLGAALLLLAVLSVLTYGLLSLAPGGPEQALLGQRPPTPEVVAAIRAQYHLDDPFPLRYWQWLSGVFSGDFGSSIYYRQPVMSVIGDRLPVTTTLAGFAILFTLAVGIPAGLAAGMRRGGVLDNGITFGTLAALAFPPFGIALVLLYTFGLALQWVPIYGSDQVGNYILPAIALGLGQAAVVIRQTRAAALDVGGQDYVTFAVARGLSRVRIWASYSLRNVALPVLTVAGLLAAANLTGAVFVERAFSLPGLGSLLIQAVNQKDIPLVQSLVLLGGAVVIAVNLLIDLAYMVVDPRVKHGVPS